MWIERQLTGMLKRAAAQFPVVVLTGARQAGKTSLLRRLWPDAEYVTLDIPREAEEARLDAPGFFARRGEPLLLDEVQYAPTLFRHLKTLVDRDRRPGRFLLTGSQDFPLMQGVTESLAGRCAVLSLPTLSLNETKPDAELKEADAFCWRGGFPELWQRPELERELWLGSYLATYLERDVRNIANVGSLRDFDRFLRAAALRSGQLLSLAELARDVGISPNTAKNWGSILQASHQIFLLEPWHRSATKRLIKTPKLYFADTGLLTYLLGFRDWAALTQHPAWGAVWESFVVSEACKHFQNAGRRPPLWFWRTGAGDEVDLLVEVGAERFLALECKTSAEPDARQLRGFGALESAYGKAALRRGAVVCRTDKPYPFTAGTRLSAIPVGGKGGLADWLAENA